MIDHAGERSGSSLRLRRGDAALTAEVRDGLIRRHRQLPTRFLADREIGETRRAVERIADERLRQVEYPLVLAWLEAEGAAQVARRMVELMPGGGTSALAMLESGAMRHTLRDYLVVEESVDPAAEGVARIGAVMPLLAVTPIVVNPTLSIPVARGTPSRFTMLGGALGRFSPIAAVRVLRAVRAAMTSVDVLLIGLDLRSALQREADGAEHDALLTTWHRHAMVVANRELGMTFPVSRFQYASRHDPDTRRVDDGLVCTSRTRIDSPFMDTLSLRPGELVRTALQQLYSRNMLESMLRGVGLAMRTWREAPDGSHGLATASVQLPQDEAS